MKGTNCISKIELAELTKVINKMQVHGIPQHPSNRNRSKKKGTSIRAAKNKLCIGRNKMHALKDKQGNIKNFNDIVLVAEKFQAELYGYKYKSSNIEWK